MIQSACPLGRPFLFCPSPPQSSPREYLIPKGLHRAATSSAPRISFTASHRASHLRREQAPALRFVPRSLILHWRIAPRPSFSTFHFQFSIGAALRLCRTAPALRFVPRPLILHFAFCILHLRLCRIAPALRFAFTCHPELVEVLLRRGAKPRSVATKGSSTSLMTASLTTVFR